MTLLTSISILLGCLASFFTVLAYLYKGVNTRIKYNKAKTFAQQGRTTSLADAFEFQSLRISNIEKYLSLPPEERGSFQPSSELINLENKAMNEYEGHHTNLTGFDT
jgi:hypothetical protein